MSSKYLAYGLAATGTLFLLAGFLLGHSTALSGPVAVAGAIAGLVYLVVGAFIVARVPANTLGWVLVVFGQALSIEAMGLSYAARGLPGAAVIAWVASWQWAPGVVALVVLVPLLFPDGALPSPGWRWVVWMSGVGLLMFLVGNVFHPELLEVDGLQNPFGFPGREAVLEPIAGVGAVLLALSVSAALVAALVRYRRSRGIQRQQMKWFAAAASLMVVAVVGMAVTYESGREDAARILFASGSIAIPAALGVAVLRYRLYEIDRIISRTLSYALLTALLVVVYVGGVLVLGGMARSLGGEAESPLVVAGSTLAVAAMFGPARRRIQGVIDRRFNRARYETHVVLESFAAALRSRVDLADISAGLQSAISQTLRPARFDLWTGEVR